MCILISCHCHKTYCEIVKGKARAFKVQKDDLAWFCLVALKITQIVHSQCYQMKRMKHGVPSGQYQREDAWCEASGHFH